MLTLDPILIQVVINCEECYQQIAVRLMYRWHRQAVELAQLTYDPCHLTNHSCTRGRLRDRKQAFKRF
jgi:hypothetical protein